MYLHRKDVKLIGEIMEDEFRVIVDAYGADQGEVSPEMIQKLKLHHDE